MASEFDSSGFSAVNKYFGNETEKAAGHKKLTASSTADSRGKRRGGVGINNTRNDTAADNIASGLLAKQILSVGRKRSRKNSTEDASEEYESGGFDDHGVHDVDEADGGRTSIVEIKVIASKLRDSEDKTEKPKKKLGKKERERQKHAVNIEVFETNTNQEYHRASDVAMTETSSKGKAPGVTNRIESTGQTTKRKRRKVRSRQKNIRKDNRSIDEKPAHLIAGNPGNRCRPLTQTTRERLNLPPPKPNNYRHKFNKDTGNNSSFFMIDRNPDSNGDDTGITLAIDEFMSNGEKGYIDKSASLNEIKEHESRVNVKKKSSKKKKKRFKNLV